MSSDDGFLAPPPGLVPAAKPADVPVAPVAPEDFISLPPGVSLPALDSATLKVDPSRRVRPEREEPATPTFVPMVAPGLPAPVVVPVAAPVTAPVAAPVTVPVAAVTAPVTAPVVTAIDEETSFAAVRRPPAPVWRIALPGGDQVSLERTALIGRAPAANALWPDATLVPVVDPVKSVSKTHVALEVSADGSLWVHDLNSTNGVSVSHSPGVEFEITPNERVALSDGTVVYLGEFEMRVLRAAGNA